MSVEDRISTLLHDLTPEPPRQITVDQVAARVGADTSRDTYSDRQARVYRFVPRNGRTWLGALAAAAAVAALAVGLAVGRDDHPHENPGTPHTPTPTATTHSAAPELTGTVHLGGATLTVPAGWVARPLGDQSAPTWCFAPKTAVAPTTLDACPLWFRELVTVPDPQHYDPLAGSALGDITGVCPDSPDLVSDGAVGMRSLGGRPAQYVEQTHVCQDARHTVVHVASYEVDTVPTAILVSAQADGAMRARMATIAGGAHLPTATAPLPVSLLGNIESKTRQSDGWHLVLLPNRRKPNGTTQPAPFVPFPGATTQSFVVPDRLVPDGGISLNGPVIVFTDGRHVTGLTIVGG